MVAPTKTTKPVEGDDDADVENETLAVVRAVPTKAKAW